MPKAKKTAPKIVDVAKPGESAPSPNSKAVIITHQNSVQDPMVVNGEPVDTTSTEQTGTDTGNPEVTSNHSKHAVIQPLATSAAEINAAIAARTKAELSGEDPKDAVGAQVANGLSAALSNVTKLTKEKTESEPQLDAAASEAEVVATIEPETEEPAEEKKPEASKPIVTTKVELPADRPVTEFEAKPASAHGSSPLTGTKDAQTDQQALLAEDTELKRTQAIDKLIETKQYYLPIVTVESRRTLQFISTGIVVCLLLAASWVDVALDAGLIQIGSIKPVTHFFTATATASSNGQPLAALPKPILTQYIAQSGGLSFQYPNSWTLMTPPTSSASDAAGLVMMAQEGNSSKGNYIELYQGNPATYADAGYTLAYIKYSKTAIQSPNFSTNHQMLSIQDVIYASNVGGTIVYQVTSSLSESGNDIAQTIGSPISQIQASFHDINGTQLILSTGGTQQIGNTGVVGFSSLASAKTYLQQNQKYIQARQLLFTAKF